MYSGGDWFFPVSAASTKNQSPESTLGSSPGAGSPAPAAGVRIAVCSGFAGRSASAGGSWAGGLYLAKVSMGASSPSAAAAGEDGARAVRSALGTGILRGLAAAGATGFRTGGLDRIRAQKRTNPSTPAPAAAGRNIARHPHGASRHQAKPPAPPV